MRTIFQLFKHTLIKFWEDDVLRMSATLSYFVLFALPPVIMILLSFFAYAVPDKAAYLTLIDQITDIAGSSFAQAIHPYSSQIDSLIAQNVTARYIGVMLLIMALAAVINQLTYALNRVWGIVSRPGQPFFFHFRQRLFSLLFILLLGTIIITTFSVHVGVNLLAYHASEYITIPYQTIQGVNAALALVSIWVLISAIYRFLPDGTMAWRDVLVGALVTSILFVLGKHIIGAMLSNSTLISIYGITGSILIVLLWIYYSCLIFFFGAEFTQVYANSHGSGISFDPHYAMSLTNRHKEKKLVN